MSFPWHDWQFWVVTCAALWGLWILIRQIWPAKSDAATPSCGGCASGTAAMAKTRSDMGQRDGDRGLIQLGGR